MIYDFEFAIADANDFEFETQIIENFIYFYENKKKRYFLRVLPYMLQFRKSIWNLKNLNDRQFLNLINNNLDKIKKI